MSSAIIAAAIIAAGLGVTYAAGVVGLIVATLVGLVALILTDPAGLGR